MIPVLILLGGELSAQQNLVPNSSFEDTIRCPLAPGDLQACPPWQRVGGSGVISLYHECGPISCGIPVSRGGGGFARSGKAHADISLVHNNHTHGLHLESNFLGIELNSTLVQGQKYDVEFYVSLFDSSRYACRDIGAYFSTGQPTNVDEILITLLPQVEYQGGHLTDKEGWMRIAGSFVAEGGEDYMTIGNFKPYQESDTINLNSGGVSPSIEFWEVAYYFIDDVSVVEDTSWHVGVDDILESDFEPEVYPNPNNGRFSIDLPELSGNNAEILLYDISGKLVGTRRLYEGLNSVEVEAADGLYLYVVTLNGAPKWHGKVSVATYR